MKLSDVNQWLTLAANLGVIAGIVFLALEIEQNTTAVRSSTIQAITEVSSARLREYASDRELAELRLKGQADPTGLSAIESFQYLAHNRGHWLHFQNVYFQYALGVLEPEVWEMYARIICVDIAEPGFRETWSDHSPVLDPGFVELVEACPEFGD